ncbi:MAG: ion transporter [Candidatus Peribacteraceae bacterium]|nr:ion transporter [Candidatus Peribacteraceae bacterium]
MNESLSLPARIHDFFERPQSLAAKLTQVVIFTLIILSVISTVIHFRYPEIYERYLPFFRYSEYVILAVFTVEYVLRLATAPHKLRFALKPMTIVDFLAVFPTYVEFFMHTFVDTTSLRVLRIIRLLRFSRVLRALKLFKFGNLFRKVIRYDGTILQTITPVIGLFVLLKGGAWILEVNGLWIKDPSLGELFAIIGFALGIILSQKIGVTYEKFTQVEEAVMRLHGTMRSLTLVLDKVQPCLGTDACHRWAMVFLRLLEDSHAKNEAIFEANANLYQVMSQGEEHPGELAMLHGEICRDAEFCLSKKVRVTPKAYDTLLHQVTMLYFGMIVVFLPGFTGIVSVIVATYTLYGMYNLTEDLDSITGGEFNLINIDFSELRQYVGAASSSHTPSPLNQ